MLVLAVYSLEFATSALCRSLETSSFAALLSRLTAAASMCLPGISNSAGDGGGCGDGEPFDDGELGPGPAMLGVIGAARDKVVR